jgi:hypothetical protein
MIWIQRSNRKLYFSDQINVYIIYLLQADSLIELSLINTLCIRVNIIQITSSYDIAILKQPKNQQLK